MKKAAAFLVILFSNSYSVSAQVNIDSLWAVWQDTSSPDAIRLNAIHKIAEDLQFYSQYDSANYYAQLLYDFAKSKGQKNHIAKALRIQGFAYYIQGEYSFAYDYLTRGLNLSEEVGDKYGIAKSLIDIGRVYYRLGDFTNTLDYYNRSLTLMNEIGDKNGVASCLNHIGRVYNKQGNYANAIDYYSRYLSIAEEIGNKKGISAALNNIGVIYANQSDFIKALDNYSRSLRIAEEIGDKHAIGVCLNNIGIIYFNQDDYINAFDYHSKSLRIAEEIGDKRGIAHSLGHIGSIHYNQGNYSNALDSYFRALTIRQEINDKTGIPSSLNLIGTIYYEQGDYDSAIAYSSRALTMAQEVGVAIQTRDAANTLYQAYKSIGKIEPALETFELYISTRDSIESEENQREVIRQEYKYEYEKQALADSLAFAKEQAVSDANLEKSRIQQYALYGGLTLLLAFLLFVYNRYRVTRDQKLIIADQNEEITTALETLKVAQAQLIQSEKMASLGQLTAGIAHEINNPLNFISSNSHALVNDLEDLEKLNNKYREALFDSNISKEEILEFEKSVDIEYLQKALNEEIEGIKEGTRRTSEIVKGLREFSQGDLVQMEPVDIHHGIDVTLNLLQSRISEDVRITRNYDQSIERINCHIGQLNQVFMNLLANAFDAIGERGTIEITTKKLENQVLISIKDDGAGIPVEVKAKVFDPFFTTKEIGKGTGLGLSISHGIIKNHGGKIEVKSPPRRQAGPPASEAGPPVGEAGGEAHPDDSVGRGKGTEFLIFLPKG